MGLDLMFNLKEAIDAGLETKVVVDDYREYGAKEQEVIILMKVPNRLHGKEPVFIELTPITQKDGTVEASVCANRWGQSYQFVTDFLITNEIEFVEV